MNNIKKTIVFYLLTLLFISCTSVQDTGSSSDQIFVQDTGSSSDQIFVQDTGGSSDRVFVQDTGSSSDRVNEVLPIVRELRELREITGWSQWSNGQWNSGRNVIPAENSSSNLGIDNIRSLKIYSVDYDNQKYVLLHKNHMRGAWRYPNIGQGWYTYTQHDYYLFPIDEFNIIISKNETYYNNFRAFRYFTANDNLNNRRLSEQVFTAINGNRTISISIPTYYNEKDKVVRFLFGPVRNPTLYPDRSLSSFYFETTFNNFFNFFEPEIR